MKRRLWAYRLYYAVVASVFRVLYLPKVHGRERLPEGGSVLCANHSSLADPILLCMVSGIRRNLVILAKKELMDIPVLGWLLKQMGVVSVDRGHADLGAIRTALSRLTGGERIGIFPEGTRVTEEDGGAAKTGAIMLASRTGLPLVPVYIPRKKKLFHRLHIVVGQPYTLGRMRGAAYGGAAAELMGRINALEAEAK